MTLKDVVRLLGLLLGLIACLMAVSLVHKGLIAWADLVFGPDPRAGHQFGSGRKFLIELATLVCILAMLGVYALIAAATLAPMVRRIGRTIDMNGGVDT